MSDVYVILGNRQLRQDLNQGTDREGYIGLVVKDSLLENDYRGFLEDCCDALSREPINTQQRPTYLSVREAVYDNEENVLHQIFLYDRMAKQGEIFELDDIVEDGAGEYMYVTQQEVNSQRARLQTLEMYVLSEGAGG